LHFRNSRKLRATPICIPAGKTLKECLWICDGFVGDLSYRAYRGHDGKRRQDSDKSLVPVGFLGRLIRADAY